MLTIFINGIQYLGFIDFRCYRSIKDFCGAFSFITSTEYSKDFPIKKGDRVVIKANNTKIFTGYVEKITPSTDATKNEVEIEGRSITCDLVDSTLTGTLNNTRNIDLKVLIERVLKEIGATDIKVISKVGILKVASFDDDNIAENCFSYLEKIAKKMNVLLTTNADGNIEIVRAGKNKLPNILLSQVGNIESNILNINYEDNDANRFYKYVVISEEEDEYTGQKTKNIGISFDTQIRKSRQLVILTDNVLNKKECKARGDWENNYRKAMSFNYTCELAGFTYNGKDIFEVNDIINLQDFNNNIKSDVLIESIEYIVSDKAYIKLTLKDSNAYTLTINNIKILGKKYAKEIKQNDIPRLYF